MTMTTGNNHAHADDHEHAASLEDALDFVNTRELTRDGYIDHLGDAASAVGWLETHGLVHGDALAPSATAGRTRDDRDGELVDRVARLRDALRELLDATVERRLPAPAVLETVNRALRAPQVEQLVPAADGVSLDHRHEGDPIDEALSRLAQVIAHEVTATDAARLRICANDECRWVFKDESPGARRKWCSMAVCGNRAKVARHRQRSRGQRAAKASPPAAQ